MEKTSELYKEALVVQVIRIFVEGRRGGEWEKVDWTPRTNER